MGKVQLSGRVQHIPGSWGVSVPVRGASIEVIDIDPGGSDDVIWTGSTDTEGKFSGTSKEWQDTKTFSVWVQDSLIPPRGHWENKTVPDPTDLLLLKVRVKQAGRTHEAFPFLNSSPVPVVVPWGPPTILTRDSRALVIVNNTVDLGRADLKALYQFLETSGDAVARAILGPYYKSITSLNGSGATTDGFCNALRAASQLPGVKAVDAIINMHGGDGKLFFFEGGSNGVAVSTVRTKLEALNIKGELRMAYNTSCYGRSHAAALCGGGFNAAIGSRKVNANSASEYPVLLSLWAAGQVLEIALAAGQAAPLREPMDAAARQLGFNDVDSSKTIEGNRLMTIESSG